MGVGHVTLIQAGGQREREAIHVAKMNDTPIRKGEGGGRQSATHADTRFNESFNTHFSAFPHTPLQIAKIRVKNSGLKIQGYFFLKMAQSG